MKNSINLTKDLSNEKLFFLCKKYGLQSKLWRQKFLGLLPEVNKRELCRKKGFNSIFEFASKLAGISEKQVRLVLNMEKQFVDKPQLKNLLINGQVSVNKLARIVSIATPINQHILANQVQLLPQKALEVLVRDERLSIKETRMSTITSPPTSLFEAENDQEHQRMQKLQLVLKTETTNELLELQNKGIDIDALIQSMLHQRKVQMAANKEQILANSKLTNSRYIPQKVKQILQEEYGEKCSIQNCKKPNKEIHHTQRFALSKSHDPKYMAPLCKEHHIIAQTIDIKYHQVRQLITAQRLRIKGQF